MGKKTGERLNELGVKIIADMSKLTIDDLIREFGPSKGLWLKQASQGIDDSPVEERQGTEQSFIGYEETTEHPENTENH